MTGAEQGFLLLTSQLGDPERHPLTAAQFRTLAQRCRDAELQQTNREMEVSDLIALGFSREMAERMLYLLSQTDVLAHYLRRGQRAGCVPLTWVNPEYPGIVRDRLGDDAPGSLWAKGDLNLLDQPMVALVGSRDIRPRNLEFARQVGTQAARQGFVLVSGNARGADRAAQQGCLDAGGQVICVVADELESFQCRENVLFLSEDGFDVAFSAQRALSRNRIIHCLGSRVFVAQCGERGGTWDGTVKNLRYDWNPVYCFQDDSQPVAMLLRMGAEAVGLADLHNIDSLAPRYFGLFDQ